MRWKKSSLKNAKLYLILDAQVLEPETLLRVLKDTVRLGIDIVQLRNKFGEAKDILDFCSKALKITQHRIPLIVNDRVDLAIVSGADGVHLGQNDIACTQARRLLGAKALIGVSCQTLAQAQKAQKDGADYIGFGSVFKTLTKPERNPMDLKMLQKVLHTIKIPVFPIGGINYSNIAVLKQTGATRAAVCRDILLSSNCKETVKETLRLLNGGLSK